MDLPLFHVLTNTSSSWRSRTDGIEVRSHELMSWHVDQPSRQFSFQRSKYIQCSSSSSSSSSSSIISEFSLNICQGNQMIGHYPVLDLSSSTNKFKDTVLCTSVTSSSTIPRSLSSRISSQPCAISWHFCQWSRLGSARGSRIGYPNHQLLRENIS